MESRALHLCILLLLLSTSSLVLPTGGVATQFFGDSPGASACQFLLNTPNYNSLAPSVIDNLPACTPATTAEIRATKGPGDITPYITSLASALRQSDCQRYTFQIPDLETYESGIVVFNGANSGSYSDNRLTVSVHSNANYIVDTATRYSRSLAYVNFTVSFPVSALGGNSTIFVSACATFQETDSTPFLFTWNGTAYTFIDETGRAFLGSPTVYNDWTGDNSNKNYTQQLNPWPNAYTPIPGSSLQSANGTFNIQFTSEKDEISYVDMVELWAINHASDVVIYSDFLQTGAVHAVTQPETQIVNCTIRDPNPSSCLSALRSLDRVDWTQSIDVSPSTVELDFGLTSQPQYFRMIINLRWYRTIDTWDLNPPLGLVTRSRMIIQQWNSTTGSYVNVPDQWNVMHYPNRALFNGINFHFTRTSLVVDLTGLPLDSSNRKIQLIFHHNPRPVQIDCVTADFNAPAVYSRTVLPVLSADLRHRGVGRAVYNFSFSLADTLNYNDVDTTLGIQSFISGMFTRYGDVTPLLQTLDDEFVIMGKGDAIALTFNSSLAPLPSTGARSYMFYNTNYYKQQGKAFGRTVDPLPFAAMGGYPYNPATTAYNTTLHASYLATYNTRNITATTTHMSLYTDYLRLDMNPLPSSSSPSPSPSSSPLPAPSSSPSRSPSSPSRTPSRSPFPRTASPSISASRSASRSISSSPSSSQTPSNPPSPSPSRTPSASPSSSRSSSPTPRPSVVALVSNLDQSEEGGDSRRVGQCLFITAALNVSSITSWFSYNGPALRGVYSVSLQTDTLNNGVCNQPSSNSVARFSVTPPIGSRTSTTSVAATAVAPGTYWLTWLPNSPAGSTLTVRYTTSSSVTGAATLGNAAYYNARWIPINDYFFLFRLG